MTIISPTDGMKSIRQMGKVGEPAKYGRSVYAIAMYGLSFAEAGIYQMRTIKMGEPTVCTKYHYKKRPIRMKFYGSSGVETEGQAAQRAKLAAAVAAYQALTPAERLVYHTNAVGLRMSGYNLFLKEQMTS